MKLWRAVGLRRHQVLQVQQLPRPRLPCLRCRRLRHRRHHRLRLREHDPPLRLEHTCVVSLLLGLVLVRLAPPLRLLPPLVPLGLRERTRSRKRLGRLGLVRLLVRLLVRPALRRHGGQYLDRHLAASA